MDRGKRFQKLQYVPKGTTKGTTNHSQQRKDEYVVSRKDCISSVSTSFVTSSGDDAGVAGVNESEALPCYASVPTSSGVQSQTVKGSVIAKTHPKSPGPMKPNNFKSTHRNESLTSTIYKPVTNAQKDIKIINKAPHMHSNFTAATTPTTYQQHVGKLSSSDTSGCHMFPPTNYRQNSSDYIQNASSTNRPNGRVSSLNDRPVSNDKFRNGESETSKEMTRGPRGHYNYFLLPPSIVNDEFETTISRDQYNLSDFQTEYETAKFYVIKSFNEDDVHKGVKYNVWTSTPNGNRKLNTAYLDSEAKLRQTDTKCPVFLFFSVNASGQFVGVAEMLGPVDFKKDMNFWKLDKYNGFFPIKWHIIKDVPNNQFVHIILRNNENKPVTFTRDTQEIGLKEGLEMLNILKIIRLRHLSWMILTFMRTEKGYFVLRRKQCMQGQNREHMVMPITKILSGQERRKQRFNRVLPCKVVWSNLQRIFLSIPLENKDSDSKIGGGPEEKTEPDDIYLC